MNIAELHIENNGLRDLISHYKAKIAELDKQLRVNEREIANHMQKDIDKGDCTLCLGDCDA